jgi:hypothetical protein
VDSDLDWGQDMKRLSARLKELGVKKVYLACLYSGDYDRLDLPEWDGLEPFRPVSGWVAVSYTMLKTNGWHMARAMGRNEPAFAWLEKYQPVAKAGKSILIYSIPAAEAGSDQ